MDLASRLAEAPGLDEVRRLVAAHPEEELRSAVEPLAREVLRMMRTDTRRALDLAQRASIVADAAGDARLRARATWMRGHGLSGMMRNAEASRCYESAARSYRELGEPLLEARVAIGWINALMYLGEYPRALSLGESARATFVRRRLLPEAARLDMNLGNIHHRVERFSDALSRYDRALRAARRTGDEVMIRIVQFNRANALTSLGRLEPAARLYRQVRDEARRAGETRTMGFAEYSLGYLELLRGEYGTAYEHLESSRTLFEQLGDPHYLTLALTDLAELFVEMNGFRRGRAIGLRARSLAERHGLRYEAARSALFEGIACLGLGQLAECATSLEDARRAFEMEGNRVASSVCALYLAELESRDGRRAEARRLLLEAAELFSGEGLPLREATARVRLAAVEIEDGRLPAARAQLDLGRRALRRVRSPWLRALEGHLEGRIAIAEGRFAPAIRHLRRSVRRIETLRGRIGIDEFRVSFSEDKAPIYADLVHALLRRGGRAAVAEAFETVERSRSRALVDLLAGRLANARGSGDAAVAPLLERLDRLRAELNWRSGFDPERGGDRRDETRLLRSGPALRRLEEDIADTVQRLQAKDRGLGALTGGETATVAEIAEGLGDAALVEYYLSRHGTTAFVVTRDGARAVDLDLSRAELVRRLSRLRFQIEKWGYGDEYCRDRLDSLQGALDGQLRALGSLLWEPLGIEQERVIVVPHGPLHSLPFHALIGAGGQPLLQDHIFSRLPSASAFRYLGRRRPGGGPRTFDEARVLAVGVGDRSIPQVDEEVRCVRRTFRRGRLLRGRRATRAAFLSAAEEADVVHLATHGVFRDDDPHFSALRLRDGWMSLYDLYGMKLSAGLVCLSACESGRSWTGAGDELVGLARGFLHAGARTLVVSLWPVQDRSTARLMEAFYGQLRRGRPAEVALRRAMQALRREFPHPYHWAPFVLIGRGGPVARPEAGPDPVEAPRRRRV